MSEDTIARLMTAIEENGKKRNLSFQDWIAMVTRCVIIMGVGVTAITSPIVNTLEDQKVITRETVKSLQLTKIDVARYHGKREP